MRYPDKFFPDATVLKIFVDSQVGQVAAEGKIRDGAGNADKAVARPRSNHYVAIVQHPLNTLRLVDRPSLGKG